MPDYKNEPKITVGVMYNYCVQGFAEKPKYYMSPEAKMATDMVLTKKLMQHTNPYMMEYFNNEFVSAMVNRNSKFQIAYDNLCLIDKDGLFLPILINELSKYTSKVYPEDPCYETNTTITSFTKFILNIAKKKSGEIVEKKFNSDGINVRIILAVSDGNREIDSYIHKIERDISSNTVDTIYILATGRKMEYAKLIAERAYIENPQMLCEPVCYKYRRYTRFISGKDSVCYELNMIH